MRQRALVASLAAVATAVLLFLPSPIPPARIEAAAETSRTVPGMLGGELSVTPNGSASYVLPIAVPPGTNGVAPELVLTYDNQAPNGVLGMGFSLHGLSSISRCPATVAVDGFVGAIDFSASDRFCLDGQRLILTSGASYGAPGSVYHTERETWTKVTAGPACGTGPCSFTAVNKDGETLEFGSSANSRVAIPGRSEVFTWKIARSLDLNSNTVEVEYQLDASQGESYPAAIRYTGNQTVGLEPLRSVDFVWEDRDDVAAKYVGGFMTRQTKRLASLGTSVSGEAVLELRFTYGQNAETGRSLLQTLEQCAPDPDTAGAWLCFPPTTFAWQAGTNTLVSPNADPNGLLRRDWCAESGGNQSSWADFNGDGKVDLTCSTPAGGQYVLLSTGDGLVSPNGNADGLLTSAWCGSAGATPSWSDFNGDGKADLHCDDDAGNHWVMLSTGTGLASPNSTSDGLVETAWCPSSIGRVAWINFDGEGRADMTCATGDGSHYVLLSTGTGLTSPNETRDGLVAQNWCAGAGATSYWGDFNGDGMSDLNCAQANGSHYVLLSTGTAVTSPNASADGLVKQNWCASDGNHRFATTDMNGDTLADLACHTADGSQLILLSTGTGVASPNADVDGLLLQSWCGQPTQIATWDDFNGDGLADLQCSDAGSGGGASGDQWVMLSTGTGLRAPGANPDGLIASGFCPGSFPQRIDFNGDALGDLHCPGSDGSQWVMLHASPFPDLVTLITNGLNGTVAIEYQPLTNSAVYQAATTPAAYPLLDVQSPLYVAARTTEGDGRGATYTNTYSYAGAQSDLLRRAWLGFAAMTSTGAAEGRSTTTTYSRTFPANGFVLETVARDAAGQVLTRSSSTPQTTEPYPQVYQVLPATQVATTYQNGQAALTLETRYQFDDRGNLELTSDLGDPTDPADDVFTCVRYDNDDATWQLGYERQRQLAKTAATCQSFLDATTPAWSPADSLRWTELDYDSRRNVTTMRAYDDHTTGWAVFSRTFDEVGNVRSIDDPGGNDSTLTWDATYRTFLVERQAAPLESGLVLTNLFTYEPHFGQLVSAIDPNGNESGWTIDAFGRVVETRGPPPDGSSRAATERLSTIELFATGNSFYSETRQRQSWDEDDPATWLWARTYLDGMTRIWQTETRGPDPSRSRWQSFLYDTTGNLWKSSYPYYTGEAPAWVVTTYDVYGQPSLVTYPDGSKLKTEYQLAARQVIATEGWGTPEARATVSTINSRGDVIALATPNGGVTRTQYSRLSQKENQTSPIGVVTTWEYDTLGRLRRIHDPDTGERVYEFDDQGFLLWATDAVGNRVDNRYDPLGRVVRRTVTQPTGEQRVTTWTYDQPQYTNALGRLTQITTAEALQELAYDRYGQVSAESLTLDGSRYTQAMDWDPAGRQIGLTYPDGAVLHTTYDDQGYVASLDLEATPGAALERYATYDGYDALGQTGRASFGSGLAANYAYYPVPQQLGRLHTATLVKGADTVSTRTFGWNVFGQLTSVAVSPDTQLSETFTYYPQGWLWTASGPYPSETFTYDLAGNVQGQGGATFTYPAHSNLLTGTSDGMVVGYDANGNTLSQQQGTGLRTFTYDGSGALTTLVEDSQTAMRAVYDSEGNRLKRIDANGVVSRYVSADYDLVEQGGDVRATKTVQGPNGVVATITLAVSDPAVAQLLRYQGHRLEALLYDGGDPRGWWLARRAELLALASHPVAAERLLQALLAVGCALLLLPQAAFTVRRLRARLARGAAPAAATTYSRRHWLFAGLAPWLAASLVLGLALPTEAELGPGDGYPQPGKLYFLENQVQSTVLVTDDQGNPLTQVAYEPYGEIDPSHSSGPDDFRPKFTGKELDHGSDLYYFGSRYHDPRFGRFLQPDPARQFQSPYTYVGDDPEDGIDSDGNFAFLIAMLVIGAVSGAYFGAAAVNHSYNPARWNWRSGKTWAGIFAGAAIGAVGGALGAVAAEAGVAVGIVGGMLIGAGENAAFTALGGGSAKEIGIAAASGALFGGLMGVAGHAVSTGVSRVASRMLGRGGALSELAERAGNAARRLFGGGCSSFPAGTLVATAAGLASIEGVGVGDQVWSLDPTSGEVRLNPVTQLFTRQAERLVHVETDGAEVAATPEHPFFVAGRGWIEAAGLAAGDRLLSRSGQTHTVAATSLDDTPAQVFNFEVARDHDYFVSPDELLVHNPKTCPAIPTVRGGKFETWWNKTTKSEFNQHWKSKDYGVQFKKTIKRRLRSPGGQHEWLMVSRADAAKQWNIAYAFFRDELRSPTSTTTFLEKATGATAKHGNSSISSLAHLELDTLITKATTFNQFKIKLRQWADGTLAGYEYALVGGRGALPSGFQ